MRFNSEDYVNADYPEYRIKFDLEPEPKADTFCMTREEVLKRARDIVCMDRDERYGKPEDNFKGIADLWGAYLGQEITSVDVANMMILLKIRRVRSSVTPHMDNFVDIAGYAACGAECCTGMAVNQNA